MKINIGDKFGKLTVIKFDRTEIKIYWGKRKCKTKINFWICQCECQRIVSVRESNLLTGNSKSCGKCKTGGLWNSVEYNSYIGMMERCYNPNNKKYYRYGARGICVCDRWKNNFLNFLEDMGPKPSKEYSLDRINNDGNYEPGNCRWATNQEQQQNKSLTKLNPKAIRNIKIVVKNIKKKKIMSVKNLYRILSKKYHCSAAAIKDLVLGRTWKNYQ